jgi:hypothetical protein
MQGIYQFISLCIHVAEIKKLYGVLFILFCILLSYFLSMTCTILVSSVHCLKSITSCCRGMDRPLVEFKYWGK